MGRPIQIGLYSPYFGTTWGGGEKYLARTARCLADALPNDGIEIASPVPVQRADLEASLGVSLDGIRTLSTNHRVTPIHTFLNGVGPLRPLRNLVVGNQAERLSARYDLFVGMSYAVSVASKAPESLMLCQFPHREGKTAASGYRTIVCASEYVRGWIERWWGRNALVVPPPIHIPTDAPPLDGKANMILSVGRFFQGGHTKRQDMLVTAFRRLCEDGLKGWELHLAGGTHDQGPHRGYYDSVVALGAGYPVVLHPNCPPNILQELYGSAAIYWHGAGYGSDPETHPEAMEHFGMTTVEAMAQGAVPVVFDAGGQTEIVTDGVDGQLFSTIEQLRDLTVDLIEEPARRRALATSARARSLNFGEGLFCDRILSAMDPAIEAARTHQRS